jgi:hypothetical protein
MERPEKMAIGGQQRELDQGGSKTESERKVWHVAEGPRRESPR